MILEEKTYVEKAEKAILDLKKASEVRNPKNPQKVQYKWITTSKIRNLLAMTADIYNDVLIQEENLSDETCSRIDYLRVRFVYECGRDEKDKVVRNFVEKTEVLDALKEIGNSRKKYILFMHYMEALVAYHKFYGGKEQ